MDVVAIQVVVVVVVLVFEVVVGVIVVAVVVDCICGGRDFVMRVVGGIAAVVAAIVVAVVADAHVDVHCFKPASHFLRAIDILYVSTKVPIVSVEVLQNYNNINCKRRCDRNCTVCVIVE
jgi:hypothetical protein